MKLTQWVRSEGLLLDPPETIDCYGTQTGSLGKEGGQLDKIEDHPQYS